MNYDKNLLDPLIHLLEIPSISTQDKYIPEMKNALHYLSDLLNSLGFNTKILKGIKHDALYAQRIENPKLKTILIYGHYDVQPPEPLEEWKTKPFTPTIKKDTLFARGSSDNKGQLMIHISAVKKLLETNHKLPINIKFIIEGEEEIGSISVKSLANKYAKKLLKCDYLIVSDTGMAKKGKPTIDISLRGLLYIEVSIQTAKHDLHSGEYGGVAENPAYILAKIISKLKNDDGVITIPGFYNDVTLPNKKEKRDLILLNETSKDIIKEGQIFGLGGGETKYLNVERKWTRPTLDINGLWSGYIEPGAKTIIPYKASAKISLRLVPNQNPDKIFKLLVRYLKKLTPKNSKLKIIRHADCLIYKAPTDNPVFDLMKKSLKKAYHNDPVFKGVGGSIGFVPVLVDKLNVPCLLVGFALPESNAHAPNENFSLVNYFKGIEAIQFFYKNLNSLNK